MVDRAWTIGRRHSGVMILAVGVLATQAWAAGMPASLSKEDVMSLILEASGTGLLSVTLRRTMEESVIVPLTREQLIEGVDSWRDTEFVMGGDGRRAEQSVQVHGSMVRISGIGDTVAPRPDDPSMLHWTREGAASFQSIWRDGGWHLSYDESPNSILIDAPHGVWPVLGEVFDYFPFSHLAHTGAGGTDGRFVAQSHLDLYELTEVSRSGDRLMVEFQVKWPDSPEEGVTNRVDIIRLEIRVDPAKQPRIQQAVLVQQGSVNSLDLGGAVVPLASNRYVVTDWMMVDGVEVPREAFVDIMTLPYHAEFREQLSATPWGYVGRRIQRHEDYQHRESAEIDASMFELPTGPMVSAFDQRSNLGYQIGAKHINLDGTAYLLSSPLKTHPGSDLSKLLDGARALGPLSMARQAAASVAHWVSWWPMTLLGAAIIAAVWWRARVRGATQ